MSDAMSGAASLSKYELQRLQTIADNRAKMEAMGIVQAAEACRPEPKTTKPCPNA